MKPLSLFLPLLFCSAVLPAKPGPVFDMEEMRDASTLRVKVLQDWKKVGGPVPTRQKLISIRVGELAPGEEYRVPVRLVVPAKGKAKGFHLSGSNNPKSLQAARPPRGPDVELIRAGVGIVGTVVQEPRSYGEGRLAGLAQERFFKTLDPKFSIQYWGWPAVLMRATTAAYAEKEHFAKGKVLMSGGSKNGASPSVALIHDDRLTAVFAGVSAGFNANLFVTGLDPMLANFSQIGARVLDPEYSVAATCNWYFMIVSTFMVTLLGWGVSTWFVERRLSKKSAEDGGPTPVDESDLESQRLTAEESKALTWAAATMGLLLLIFAATVFIPGMPMHDRSIPVPGDPGQTWLADVSQAEIVLPDDHQGLARCCRGDTNGLCNIINHTNHPNYRAGTDRLTIGLVIERNIAGNHRSAECQCCFGNSDHRLRYLRHDFGLFWVAEI